MRKLLASFCSIVFSLCSHSALSTISISESSDIAEEVSDCLLFHSMDVKVLENRVPQLPVSSLQTTIDGLFVSWQASVENVCDSPVFARFSLADGFENRFSPLLAVGDVTLEKNSAREVVRGLTIIAESDFFPDRGYILHLEELSLPPDDRLDCFGFSPLQPIVHPVHPNVTNYQDISWGVDIENYCDKDFLVPLLYEFLDSDGFLVNWFIDDEVIVPAFGRGKARGLFPVLQIDLDELDSVHAKITTTFVNKHSHRVITKWLETAQAIYDQDIGRLDVDVEIENAGSFSVTLNKRENLGDGIFELDPSSISKLEERPVFSSQYNEESKILLIPAIRTTDGTIANNVSLELINPDELLFQFLEIGPSEDRLEFFEFLSNSDCITVGDVSSEWFEPLGELQEISWEVDVSIQCDSQLDVRVDYFLLSQDDMILASLNLNVGPSSFFSESMIIEKNSIVDLSRLPQIPVKEAFVISANSIHSPFFFQ